MIRALIVVALAVTLVVVALPVFDGSGDDVPPDTEPREPREALVVYGDATPERASPATAPRATSLESRRARREPGARLAAPAAPDSDNAFQDWLQRIDPVHREAVLEVVLLAERCAARNEDLPQAAIRLLAARIGQDVALARAIFVVLRDHAGQLGAGYGPLVQAGIASGQAEFIGPYRQFVQSKQRSPTDAAQVRSALQSNDLNLRVETMRRLDGDALAGDPALRSALAALVRDPTTGAQLRSATILALSRAPNRATEQLLLDRYHAAEATERADIVRRLANFPPTPRLTQALLSALASNQTLAIRRFAVRALARHTSPTARDALVGALESDDETTRRNAVIALTRRAEDPIVRTALATRLVRETVPNIRSRIQRVLR